MPVLVSESNPANMDFEDTYPLDVSHTSNEGAYLEINPTFPALLAGKIDGQNSTLDYYLYDSEASALMLHHDIILSHFPVCLEWLGLDPGSIAGDSAAPANLAILGTMAPEIEIWDINAFEPASPLTVLSNAHTDSVTGLALHSHRPNILASSSADRSARLWDLETQRCVFVYENKSDKLNGLLWDENNESALVLFSMDNVIKHIDVRSGKAARKFKATGGSLEAFSAFGHRIFAGFDDGTVSEYDIRAMKSAPVNRIQANDGAVMGLACTKASFLVSNGANGQMRLFGLSDLAMRAEEKTRGEELYVSSVCPDDDSLIAFGSSGGDVAIWDITEATK